VQNILKPNNIIHNMGVLFKLPKIYRCCCCCWSCCCCCFCCYCDSAEFLSSKHVVYIVVFNSTSDIRYRLFCSIQTNIIVVLLLFQISGLFWRRFSNQNTILLFVHHIQTLFLFKLLCIFFEIFSCYRPAP